jgi:hypothetical protein
MFKRKRNEKANIYRSWFGFGFGVYVFAGVF